MNHFCTKPGYSRFRILLKAFSLLLLLTAAQGFAQNTTLSGTISAEGQNLPLADIVNTTTGEKQTSDSDGNFTIALQQGNNILVFYRANFSLLELEIASSQTSIAVELKKAIELNEVFIQKERDKLFALTHLKDIDGTAIYAGKKTEVINIDKLTANKSVNNARQVFAQVVGLTINDNSDGGLQLNIGGRGLNPNRTSNFNTRQNGYDISADVLGYPESYYTPPVEALQEIQVVRGAASLQYGTQFGGLVNFKLKSPTAKPIEVQTRATAGSYGLLTNFTSVSGTNKKFSFYTFFNYKQGDGFRPNSAFSSRNFFINLNYQFTPKTSVHLDYTLFDYLARQPGGLTDAMFYQNPKQSNRSRNWFDVNWNLFAFRLNHAFTERANFSLQLFGLDASRSTVGYRTNRVSENDLGGVRDLIVGDFVNWGAEARYLQKYTIKGYQSALLLGAKYYQARNTALQGPGSTGSGPDFSIAQDQVVSYRNQSDYVYPNQNVSFFGENIFRLSPKFTVTPGFRIETIRTQAQGTWQDIRLDQAGNVIFQQQETEDITKNRNFALLGVGLSYKPTNRVEFYGNVSQNYRSVTFNDIRTVSPSFVVDPNITDEKGFTADLGMRGTLNDNFSYDTSLYALLYDDKIGEIQITDTDGRIKRYRTNLGTAITYGWEALGDWNIANTFFKDYESFAWNVFVNSAITGSDYLKTNVKSTDGADIKGNRVEFVPTFNLKTGTGVGYKNFLASLQLTYMSSQFSDGGNNITTKDDNTFGFTGEIPSYYVADFSASYRWRFIKLEAGVNNVTNNYYFTRRATGYPGPGILPSDPRTYYTTIQVTF